MAKIVAIAVKHPLIPDLFLHGRRRDAIAWCIPAGHVNPGESDLEAARRELREETGLDIKDLKFARYGTVHEPKDIALFEATAPMNVSLKEFSLDPDEEFSELRFLDPRSSQFEWYVPKDKNVLLQHLDGDLAKSDPRHDHFNNRAELEQYLKNGKFALLAAYREHRTPEENLKMHRDLERDLERRGIKHTPVKGRWMGQDEPSFMLHDVPEQVAGFIARKYGQMAHIQSDSGNHKDISHDPGYEPQPGGSGHEFGEHLDDNYAEVTFPHGEKSRFRLNLQPSAGHPHNYDWHDGHSDHHSKVEKADPHPHGQAHGPNAQAAGAGVSTYHDIASDYGKITPGKRTNLQFYRGLEQHEPKIDQMIGSKGYQTYFAGGKHGKPDLATKNYNTKHLMVYDPTPSSGGDFGDEAFTRSWRKLHELAHAETYPEINKLYGEGRRLGKLGVRTPREAKRAIHWEWLAAHKQRDLAAQLGMQVPDQEFHKELNTVMHDAVHRAVHGTFTEPSEEGFDPHSHKVPLEHALSAIDEHAKRAGLNHDEATRRQPSGVSGQLAKIQMDESEYAIHYVESPNDGIYGDPVVHIIAHHKTSGEDIGHAAVYEGSSQMGSELLPGGYPQDHKNKFIVTSNVHVDPSHRRKGVASAMYAYAERLHRKKMHPSENLMNDGHDLWDALKHNVDKSELTKTSSWRTPTAADLAAEHHTENSFFDSWPQDLGTAKPSVEEFLVNAAKHGRIEHVAHADIPHKFSSFHSSGDSEDTAGRIKNISDALAQGQQVPMPVVYAGYQGDPGRYLTLGGRTRLGAAHESGKDVSILVLPYPKKTQPAKKSEFISKSIPQAKLVHYSPVSNLKELDPTKMGTGVRSEEYRRGLPAVPRTYYYREGTTHEPMVTSAARSRYTISLRPEHRIYDLAQDPEGLARQALKDNQNAWNSDMVYDRIKQAGYHGLYNSKSSLPNVIAMFHPMKVESEESLRKDAISPETSDKLARWQHKGRPGDRKAVFSALMRPEHAADRQKMLSAMRHEGVPRKKIGGVEHFLLHRGGAEGRHPDLGSHVRFHAPLSFSTRHNAAEEFSSNAWSGGEGGSTHSVWVPHTHIAVAVHHSPLVGGPHQAPALSNHEREVIAAPGSYPKASAKELNTHTESRLNQEQSYFRRRLKKDELAKGLNGDWKKEGYTFRHSFSPASLEHQIVAHDKTGKPVGWYDFREESHDRSLLPQSANTDQDHRRKGLATQAYKTIESVTGRKLIPSDLPFDQSPDARSLWAQPNRQFGKSKLTKSLGDWKKAGYTIQHNTRMGQFLSGPRKVTTVVAFDPKGNHVAMAMLRHREGMLHPHSVDVDEDHRRLGIASAMYAHAEKATKMKILPSEDQSEDAEKLWAQKGRPFGKKELDPSLGYKISHGPADEGALPGFKVSAHDKAGNLVGWAHIVHGAKVKQPWSDGTYVEPEHRRRGIASALYQHAEKVAGKPMRPAAKSTQTSEGASLWGPKRQLFGKSEELAKAPFHYSSADAADDMYVDDIFSPRWKTLKEQTLPSGLVHRVSGENTNLTEEAITNNRHRKVSHDLYSPNGKTHLAQLKVSTNEDVPTVTAAIVRPEFAGRNFGKHLYLAALKHHGKLQSDLHVSPEAHRVWQKMGQLPGADVSLAPYVASARDMYNKLDPRFEDRHYAGDVGIPDEAFTGKKYTKLFAPKTSGLKWPKVAKSEGSDKESELIAENRKTKGKDRHKFQASEWTHPNGHPRCRLCGAEQRNGNICEGAAADGYGQYGHKIKKSEDLEKKIYSYDEVVASAGRAGNPDIADAKFGGYAGVHKPGRTYKLVNVPVGRLHLNPGTPYQEFPHQVMHSESKPHYGPKGIESGDEYHGRLYAKKYPHGSTAEPIVVHPTNSGTYEILDGRHRSRAAYLRGEQHIRAFVPIMGPGIIKSEELAKRSKNVRQKLAGLSPNTANKRIAAYAARLGVTLHYDPPQVGFPKIQGTDVAYGAGFGASHELAHALMTPTGSTIEEYTKELQDKIKTNPYSGDLDADPMGVDEATSDENVARRMESRIARRAGVLPKHIEDKFSHAIEVPTEDHGITHNMYPKAPSGLIGTPSRTYEPAYDVEDPKEYSESLDHGASQAMRDVDELGERIDFTGKKVVRSNPDVSINARAAMGPADYWQRKLKASRGKKVTKSELSKGSAQRRVMPFSPPPKYSAERENMTDWTRGGRPQAREYDIQPLKGAARLRALHRISKVATSRRNPESGELEFLLHRGMSNLEHQETTGAAHYGSPTRSSWSALHQAASLHPAQVGSSYRTTVSAWVPSSKVLHYPNIIGDEYEGKMGSSRYKGEHEVIVDKDTKLRLASPEDVEKHKRSFYAPEVNPEPGNFPIPGRAPAHPVERSIMRERLRVLGAKYGKKPSKP